MNRLPLTVIGGYLGAGKTTLINRLLAEPHGRRLMVMVNDFGAINIDQSLIAAQSEDLIALSNGCVCCTMGADLYMAIGDALDRVPRADHLIIEASGVADPKAIANTALAEPDLSYGGIITLVDALNIGGLLRDDLVAAQVRQQIAAADLVFHTKGDAENIDLKQYCDEFEQQSIPPLGAFSLTGVILDVFDPAQVSAPHAHPRYTAWSRQQSRSLDHQGVMDALAARPPALYRVKGFVRTERGVFELHAVGRSSELLPASQGAPCAVVALGVAARLSMARIDDWWDAIPHASHPAMGRELPGD
ncbi:MAG: CobW family GTP-binding protein [Pseudomonadota bacterium]